MFKELNKITDLAEEINSQSVLYTNSIDNLINTIESKINLLKQKNTSSLSKTYYEELLNSLQFIHEESAKEFTDIEKSLNEIYIIKRETLNEEIKDGFILSKNFHAICEQATNIKSKIKEILKNKEKITQTADELKHFNHAFKMLLKEALNDIDTILSELKDFEWKKKKNSVNKHYDTIWKKLTSFSKKLQTEEEKNNILIKLALNTVTDEKLKITSGMVDSIIEKTNNIYKQLQKNNSDTPVDQSLLNGIIVQSEELISSSNEIKQILGKITRNIDALPDTSSLEKSLQNIYSILGKISEEISSKKINNDFELNSKITIIKEDFSTIKNIVTDLNEILISKIDSNIAEIKINSIKELISKIVLSEPKKEDIKHNLKKSYPKEESFSKFAYTNNSTQNSENSPKESLNYENWLANPGNNNNEDLISRLYDQKNIDGPFLNKFETLRKDIITSQKESENKIITNLDNINEEIKNNVKIENAKNEILSHQTSNQENIINQLSELNKSIEKIEPSADVIKGIKDDIISGQKNSEENVLSNLGNIDRKLDNSSNIEDFKNEILSHQTSNQESIINQLSELNKSIEKIETSADVIKGIKDDIIAGQKNSEESVLSNLGDIDKKLNNNIDIEEIKNEIINEQSINQNEIINKLSEITTLIENDLKTGDFVNFTDDLRTQINEIISQINKNIENSFNNKKEISDSIEKYFLEIKSYITESKSEPDTELKDLINNIESKIEEYKNNNQNFTNKIIEKISALEKPSDEQNSYLSEDIKSSLNEISEIKKQIEELGQTFGNVNTNNDSETNIKQFVSEKMQELGSDVEKMHENLNEISENLQNGMQEGFSYNTKYIEEKYTLLLDLIKELRHASTDNIELFERLTVTDNKLMDFKQELDLVNTDVTNILNSKTEEIIKTINSIKETVKETPDFTQIENNNFKSILEEIHNLSDKISFIIQDDEIEEDISDPENNKENFEKLYDGISQKLNDTKDNIRDFILGDIDSVIIKVDNIKEYLTDKLDSIVPPNPDEMKELNQFVSQIAQFKKDNEKYLQKIEASINEKHDELKSMLTVAINNKEILNAIKNLKEYFNSKINDFEITEDDNIFSEGNNQFENNQEVVSDLKENFGLIADQIDSLSGQNTDIEYILNNIYDKIDSIKLDNNSDNKRLIGENNFDFAKAFDLLSDDIKTLKNSVNKVIQDGDKKYSLGAETAYTKISSKLENILTSAKNDWLEEIKNYLTNNELKNLISEINNKIDIIALTNNSEDGNNNDVKKLLDIVNTKIDILAANDNITEFEELKYSIESLIQKLESNNSLTKNNDDKNISASETQITSMLEALNSKLDIIVQSDNYEQIVELSDSDAQITSMLETLNHKIDILAQADTSLETENNFEDIKQLIIAQKDYIDKLEPSEKLDTFKKCLEKLSLEINNISGDEIHKTLKDMKESIMDAVVTIFNQVSFAEESEDIKDFVEEKTEKIAKNLEEVTRQIKQIAFSDDSEDYNYSMQDIETDLAKLRIALNDLNNNAHLNQTNDELTNIADTLNRITYTVDTLSQDEIQDLKSDITNLKEQTKQLLMSSDASFSTINNDIVYKVDNVTQLLEKSHDSDKVMRQALIYMGEWIDSASESMNKISSNSDEILNIKSTLEEKFDDQQKHLNYVEKQITKLENLEAKFEQQEARIDRLEENLDKILSVVEDIDNSGLMRKVDKIEKQLTKLSSNIEKLTSYVDG